MNFLLISSAYLYLYVNCHSLFTHLYFIGISPFDSSLQLSRLNRFHHRLLLATIVLHQKENKCLGIVISILHKNEGK